MMNLLVLGKQKRNAASDPPARKIARVKPNERCTLVVKQGSRMVHPLQRRYHRSGIVGVLRRAACMGRLEPARCRDRRQAARSAGRFGHDASP